MKKAIKLFMFILLITSLSLFSTSCKKSDPNSGIAASSQWSFDGGTYKPIQTLSAIAFNQQALYGIGPGQPGIYIYFGTNTQKAGVYNVVNGPSVNLTYNQCVISIITTNQLSFYSLGSPGGTVTVTVSGGKMTASFNNITVANIQNNVITSTGTVSGTLVHTQPIIQ